ncbi:MAG TPA: tetratricopeptide repeat protein [Pirellulales bacterium]|jgi:tetratricopeptide (TPR) repeat protein|nr:tetratricopeptide repeat protein [Pirellulales bacterium]
MRPVFAALLSIVLLASAAFSAEPWLGQKVFWKPGAKAKVGTEEIAIETIAFPATVEEVNGDWLWLGRAWVQKQDVATADQALEAYTTQIRGQPKNAVLWTCRGAIWRAKGDYERAIQDFSEAIRLDPRQVAAYNDRGSALSHEGRNDSAINDLSEAIRLDPAFTPAYTNRGIVWCRLHEFDNAIRDLSEAVRMDPKDPEAYQNRGGAHAAKGEYERAIQDFGEAIRLDSTDALAYYNRAGARNQSGDYRGALKDYDQAIRLDPKDADALADRGSVWATQGNYESALRDYREALRLDPQSAAANNNLAWLQATCPDENYRDGKQAVENATRACQLAEWKDAARLDTLAAAYAETGDFENARKWEDKAIDLAADADKESCRAHLALYQAGKPFRAEPKK